MCVNDQLQDLTVDNNCQTSIGQFVFPFSIQMPVNRIPGFMLFGASSLQYYLRA